ncbi:hypothetical protein [Xanthomonas sacchari]|uniref:hypothetical protein n=1 Tax=Xanthomonas sacchari TaxID=56458 RepID=UPI00352932C3
MTQERFQPRQMFPGTPVAAEAAPANGWHHAVEKARALRTGLQLQQVAATEHRRRLRRQPALAAPPGGVLLQP